MTHLRTWLRKEVAGQNCRWLMLFLILLIFRRRCEAELNLEGEIMKISELNGATDLHKLKTFECMDSKNCQAGNPGREPSCTERRRQIGLQQNGTDKYVIVMAEKGRTVQLDCHYCHEMGNRDDGRVWYYYDKFLASKRFKVVPQHLDYPEFARKFVVNEDDHRLNIRNFTEADGAMYFCQGLDDKLPKFNFLVDIAEHRSDLEPNRGTLQQYLEYHKTNVAPLNKKLREEYKQEIKKWFFNVGLSLNYNVSHNWSKWGKCRSCGRPHGIRMRTGICELTIPGLHSEANTTSRRGIGMELGFKFSCHSSMLKRFLTTKLYKKVNAIADFIEELPCEAECTLSGIISNNTENGGSMITAQGSKVVRALTVIATVGEEVTLDCAETSAADVVWLKDNVLLSLPDTSSKRSKGMTFTKNRGGLHFPALSATDAGNYTCIVNDVVQMKFILESQESIEDLPIPVDWIWIHLTSFSIVAVFIWIIVIICIARKSRHVQSGYQKLSSAEESFLKRKNALLEGYDDEPGNRA